MYDPGRLGVRRSPLHQAVFALLADESSFSAARAALAALERDFLSLNAVRVARYREVERILDRARVSHSRRKAVALRRLLSHVYESQHEMSLDTLATRNLADVKKALEKIPVLDRLAVDAVLQYSLDYLQVAVYPALARPMRRLGIAAAKATDRQIAQKVASAVPKEALAGFCVSAIEFGDAVCLDASPKCKSCPFLRACPEGARRAEEQRKSARRAVRRRASGPSARRKPAPRAARPARRASNRATAGRRRSR